MGKVIAEIEIDKIRIAVIELADGQHLKYEVINHSIPMDRTIQPDLFHTYDKEEALDKFNQWKEQFDSGVNAEVLNKVSERQNALDKVEEQLQPHGERVMGDIKTTLQKQGIDALLKACRSGQFSPYDSFEVLAELEMYSPAAVEYAEEIATDESLECHERRDAAYYISSWQDENAVELKLKVAKSLLDIHWRGGDANCEASVIIMELGDSDSADAVNALRSFDLSPPEGVKASGDESWIKEVQTEIDEAIENIELRLSGEDVPSREEKDEAMLAQMMKMMKGEPEQ